MYVDTYLFYIDGHMMINPIIENDFAILLLENIGITLRICLSSMLIISFIQTL